MLFVIVDCYFTLLISLVPCLFVCLFFYFLICFKLAQIQSSLINYRAALFFLLFFFNFLLLFHFLCHSLLLASLQASFSYPLADSMPFDYHCNAYGNNNTTNHNHNNHTNNGIHVNNSMATAAALGEWISFVFFISKHRLYLYLCFTFQNNKLIINVYVMRKEKKIKQFEMFQFFLSIWF